MDPVLSTNTAQPGTLNTCVVINIVQTPRKSLYLSCALCLEKSDCIWMTVAVEERNCCGVGVRMEQQKPVGKRKHTKGFSNPSSQITEVHTLVFTTKCCFPVVPGHLFPCYCSCSNLCLQKYKLLWYL